MRKIIVLSIAMLVSASFSTAYAEKKKDKKQKQEEVVAVVVDEPVILATPSDSISYAAGKTATQGLIPYLQQQHNVDTA